MLTAKSLAISTNFFAQDLLDTLQDKDPIFAAFEAQDVSRAVGFDFATMPDVLERALDEVRETREAFEETGDDAHDHFGDEIADLAFSLTNLIRHKGAARNDLVRISDLKPAKEAGADVIDSTETIADNMRTIASEDTELAESMNVYNNAMQACAQLATSYGFEVGTLLRANVSKYLIRCAAIETLAAEDGKDWGDLYSDREIVAYWKRAKSIL